MKDLLDLNFSDSFSYIISPSLEIEEHGNKLKSITDFRKKLKYYNDNICTLSYAYYGQGLHYYGSYDHHHGVGEVFLKKGADKNNDPNFNAYLDVRQEEIDRIKLMLVNKENYGEKLKFFIEKKAGQYRYNELNIINNAYTKFLAEGGGTVPIDLQGDNDEIDLNPQSDEERKIYNLYLLSHVEQLITNPDKFHVLVKNNYFGFLLSPALSQFLTQLENALNRNGTIESEIRRIEAKFSFGYIPDYIDDLYSKRSNFLEWQSALFASFVNGKEYDFGHEKLSMLQLRAYMHIKQIFEYYKKLHILKSTTSKNSKVDKKDGSKPRHSTEYIKEELLERLSAIESNLADKIKKWNQGLDKIQCAAFCELLYDRKYLITGSTRVKTVNMFSLTRYGNEIAVQLSSAKKKERELHKSRLIKHF